MLLLAPLVLAGCGPLYHTTYDYTPPRNHIGQLCSTQCSNTRDSCRGKADSLAQSRYSQCDAQAQQAYEACLAANTSAQQNHVCLLQQCQSHANYDHCDADYRSCYSACGGVVTPQKKCVFDCPKTAAAGDS